MEPREDFGNRRRGRGGKSKQQDALYFPMEHTVGR